LDQFEARHVRPKPGRTLIVGSRVYPGREDRRSRFTDVLGVDIQPGPGVDVVADLEAPQPDLGKFDHIECLSVLEHTRRPWLMAEVLTGMLVVGGTIFVSVPFVHRVHGYPSDFWRMTPDGLRSIFPAITWDAVMLASTVLREGPKVPAIKVDDHPYLARTQTVGFGRK
jgi:hypothetical protein